MVAVRNIMKKIPVEQAVGMALPHDITRIVPGDAKGRAFARGHIIQPEDVPALLDLGKENIYVLDLHQGLVHEDAAARRIARAAAGDNLRLTDPSEGRVNLEARTKGLLKIQVEALREINEGEEVVFATLHTHQPVSEGQAVAGTRIIPLATPEETVLRVERICGEAGPVVEVKPYRALKTGIVTTGSEIYRGRIEDKFGPVLRKKFGELGCPVMGQTFVSDSVSMTVEAIHRFVEEGAELVAVTGGMSVDPDDQTPASIRTAGGKVITYGAPVFPGAMFMLADLAGVPVVGLPGCVMYYRASIFDLIVPRILAGEPVTRRDVAAMGHGGFCAGCPACRFPLCSFGKGS